MSTNRNLLESKLRLAFAQLPYLVRALTLVWNSTRGWTVAWLVLLAAQGLLPVATVYLTRALVDALVLALQAEASWITFRPLLLLVGLMALVLLLTEVLHSAENYVGTVQAELVRDHISGLIHRKSVAVDLAFYDTPEYHDHLYRAQYLALDRPLMLLESLGSLVQNAITLVAMMGVLIPYSVWLPVALVASGLPALFLAMQHQLRLHRWRLKTTESERRSWYYNWLMTDREVAAELRIFDLGKHFDGLYQTLRGGLRSERLQLAWDQSIAELAAAVTALLITGLTLAWMLWKAVQGALSLGDLALFYQAFHQSQRVMRAMLENLGQIYSSSLFLKDLFEFLTLQPQISEPAQPLSVPARLQEGIRFEQVTFRYPGSQRFALRDFSLTVPAGGVVAIMGANGAGKSTLIKLLCRFYDPDHGRVLLEGIDLRRLRLPELRRQLTILFQEPVHYQNTVLENIALGDLTTAINPTQIERAARAAGADGPITRLPQGYDTLLGKWFKDGAELSVGEWQRLALARAYWRMAPVIVLDEPTSAMDPWAEHDWLRRFRQLASDRTALIITHRFTTAMHADIIHVMEEGQIVESGSHAELLALGGRYAQSWQEQMQVGQAQPDRLFLPPRQAVHEQRNGAGVDGWGEIANAPTT